MIVWGGQGVGGTTWLNTGARYNPVANNWTALPTTNAPLGRESHTAIWTGSEMLVWGGAKGVGSSPYNTGGRYNPVANSWAGLTTNGAPSARRYHTAVWTGSKMVVWGGAGSTNSYAERRLV